MAFFVNENREISYDLKPLFAGGAISNKKAVRERDEYIIHYILRGKGTFILNGEKYSVCAGELFIIKPNEKAVYFPEEHTEWQYVWIGFEGKYAERLYELDTPVIKANTDPFSEIYLASPSSTKGNEFYLAKLYEIFAQLFPRSDGKKADNNYAKKIRGYIEMRYCDGITIDQIAKDLHIDKSYLSRCYKKEYGHTPKSALTSLQMTKAIYLMSKGHSAKSAAARIGYKNESTFFAAFNRHFGTTPQKYINNIKIQK